MVHRVLIYASLISCALVVASFTLFAHDQLAGASQRQQTAVLSGSAPVSRTAARHHVGQPRRFIDSAAATLTAPFDALVHSDSQWVTRGVPAILALLAYGVGLGTLARFAQGGRRI